MLISGFALECRFGSLLSALDAVGRRFSCFCLLGSALEVSSSGLVLSSFVNERTVGHLLSALDAVNACSAVSAVRCRVGSVVWSFRALLLEAVLSACCLILMWLRACSVSSPFSALSLTIFSACSSGKLSLLRLEVY